MKTSKPYPRYIPDHLRAMRTDRLVHYRDSLILIAQRNLPLLWVNQDAADKVRNCHLEIMDVNELLKRRERKHSRTARLKRNERYEMSWS